MWHIPTFVSKNLRFKDVGDSGFLEIFKKDFGLINPWLKNNYGAVL